MNTELLYELLKEQTFQGIARNGPVVLAGHDISPLLDDECTLLARHGRIIGVDAMSRHAEYAAAGASGAGGRRSITAASSLWKTMRSENAQYGIVYTYDAENKRLRRNATTKTLEYVTRARRPDIVRVFYTKEAAGECATRRTVRNRFFGGENGTTEYVFFYTRTSDQLHENGYAIMEALPNRRLRYRIDYRKTMPHAQFSIAVGESAGGYVTLTYASVADDKNAIEIQNTAAFALPPSALTFDVRQRRSSGGGMFVLADNVHAELRVFLNDAVPQTYAVRFNSDNIESFTVDPDGKCVLRCTFAEQMPMIGVLVVVAAMRREGFTLAPFHAALIADGGGESATPALIHHLIEYGMTQHDIGEFTNHGAAATLLPLLPLVRGIDEERDLELLAMREFDTALVEFVRDGTQTSHAQRLNAAVLRAQMTPGADAYVERVEQWLNTPDTGLVTSVVVTQVSISCTPQKFAADATLAYEQRHLHKTYETKQFEPLFVMTATPSSANDGAYE